VTTLSDGDAFADIRKSLEDKRRTAENALTKVLKDAPTPHHELKAVEEARSSYEVFVQARRDREEKGAKKAVARAAGRRKHLADVRAQVVELETEMLSLEAGNVVKHASKVKDAADMDVKVLALLDRRIADLKSAAAAPPPTVPTPAVPQAGGAAAASAPQPVLAAHTLAVALPEAPALDTTYISTLEAQRVQISQLQAQLQVEVTRADTLFNAVFEEVKQAHLPPPELPGQDQLQAYVGLYQTLMAWSMAGAATPFDWAALETSTGQTVKPADLAKTLLGDVWNRWYLDAPPVPRDVVPRQVATLMLSCLNRVKIDYDAAVVDKPVEQMALEGYEAVRASAKRLRTELS